MKEYYTSILRLKGSMRYRTVPVKSTQPMDRSLFIECSKVLARIYVGIPLQRGDVVCNNILNTGIDIIVTRTIDS